ncbi:hypothetical protein E2C01_026045 [Portunus trituberculatus]|uniref:Uncharacterized protein n=1 Tax=Portunus trituberculatus TaxID=210409 RepID=A0A5B7EHL6_PORTR|nr:hypothetical protein [Portunus trituberculatus]
MHNMTLCRGFHLIQDPPRLLGVYSRPVPPSASCPPAASGSCLAGHGGPRVVKAPRGREERGLSRPCRDDPLTPQSHLGQDHRSYTRGCSKRVLLTCWVKTSYDEGRDASVGATWRGSSRGRSVTASCAPDDTMDRKIFLGGRGSSDKGPPFLIDSLVARRCFQTWTPSRQDRLQRRPCPEVRKEGRGGAQHGVGMRGPGSFVPTSPPRRHTHDNMQLLSSRPARYTDCGINLKKSG